MKKKSLISIEDQLAPLGGLWEKKGGYMLPRVLEITIIKYLKPVEPKKKKTRMGNCGNCKWKIFDGQRREWLCLAVGGDVALYINNSPRCKKLYRPV